MPLKDELLSFIGREQIFDDDATLNAYAHDESFSAPNKPACVVKPINTRQVMEIVTWANRTATPIVPVSSPGGPRFRGDTIPSHGGIVVDLSAMKSIRVDRRDRVAMIEPGVTFAELQTELQKQGLKPFVPLMPRPTKSALASYLEREPILIPKNHWDAVDPLICVEVVFGSGDQFRTGSAAGPRSVQEEFAAGVRQVNPAGPGLTSLSRVLQGAQGTLGIVTWATVVCGLQPTVQKSFLAGTDTLEAVVDVAYDLLHRRIGEEFFIVNNFLLASMAAPTGEDIPEIARTLPPWIMVINLTGHDYYPEDRIAYQEQDVRQLAKHRGLVFGPVLGDVEASTVLNCISSPPTNYYKIAYKGGCADIPFIATLDRMPGLLSNLSEIIHSMPYSADECGIYLQPMVQGCTCHAEASFMYDPGSAEEKDTIRVIVQEASKKLADGGAFFSRPYGNLADIAFSRDPAAAEALKKVKSIFDPQHIMNPGKLCF